jgi:hypothetical protein
MSFEAKNNSRVRQFHSGMDTARSGAVSRMGVCGIILGHSQLGFGGGSTEMPGFARVTTIEKGLEKWTSFLGICRQKVCFQLDLAARN